MTMIKINLLNIDKIASGHLYCQLAKGEEERLAKATQGSGMIEVRLYMNNVLQYTIKSSKLFIKNMIL